MILLSSEVRNLRVLLTETEIKHTNSEIKHEYPADGPACGGSSLLLNGYTYIIMSIIVRCVIFFNRIIMTTLLNCS